MPTNFAQWKVLEAKSVSNLLKSIEKARTVEAKNFLYALFIPLVGQDVCARLLSAYPLSELISTAQTTTDLAVFSTISGIGPEKSTSFVKWLQDKKNKNIVEHLLAELEIKEATPIEKGSLCNGLTFVVTGDVHHYKNRNELKVYIESQGGKVTGKRIEIDKLPYQQRYKQHIGQESKGTTAWNRHYFGRRLYQ